MNTWNVLAADKSMVFLSGARQSGKTTLARLISQKYSNSIYFNWDMPAHKKMFIENPLFFEHIERKDNSKPLVILDEIHKYRGWKNYLKGAYDQCAGDFQFLVSGSGRLDLYQKGGDSLAGRYLLFHLFPFTMAELAQSNATIDKFITNPAAVNMNNAKKHAAFWEKLEEYSGFPEPFLKENKSAWRRWSSGYAQRLIKEDIRDIVEIKNIGNLETLFYLLPSRIGSPLSATSLAGDIKVSYNTVQSWLSVFERFFLTFSIPTWTKHISRAIQKERKVYLFDFPRIDDAAARFENMVALELYRAVTSWNDLGHGDFSLHFIKNKEQQEVDFLIANKRNPVVLVEAKLNDTQPSKALLMMQKALNIPAVQLVRDAAGFRTFSNEGQKVVIAPAYQWLSGLPW